MRRFPFGLPLAVLALLAFTTDASAQTLSNASFNVQIGKSGEISSLKLTGDAFPTNYVLNATNAPGQNTADHQWMGELMFTYKVGAGAWTTALTSQSDDVRKIAQTNGAITVSYEGSTKQNGIHDLKVVETYSLVDDSLTWQIALTNTTGSAMEVGDVGLPLPFNEYWFGQDKIYETRVVYHSFTGQNSSYITATRPSGVGPFLLLMPDATTGAGFEYMDNWRKEEHPTSTWAANGGMPQWPNGLDVFYIHSNVIKSTHRGYLPNTSLMLAAGESHTYAFKFFKVASQDEVKSKLYDQGLIDVTVVPGMMFATDMKAKLDLHTKKPIHSVTAQYPAETTITSLGAAMGDHNLYQVSLSHLGQNDLVVSYGDGETTTLQFYALEPIGAALQRHATFMVEKTQATSGMLKYAFDDWMMDSKTQRGATGGWGWGDDWGWTKGQFLAEKNALTPVASEVTALDTYLEAIWGTEIDPTTHTVNDWWCPSITTPNCGYDRAFAYPHAFNTYFSMYKIAHLYPSLVKYHQTADTYLMRAYGILNTLYNGHGDPGTGYMGEQTLPDIAQALSEANHGAEAKFVTGVISKLYAAFKASPYPYGSEYSYDNTGEEAVYMAAKASGDSAVLAKVNAKTRACRGQEPVWYYYADPVTLNGENWWQFQYSTSLVGYCMDDYLRTYSKTPELDERLSYAAKLGNISAINSGQIDPDPANLGAVSWTYQAMKGNVYVGQPDSGKLHNGWRNMSGEADLGLFGAIRILSSDVAVDPIFGVYGYGCDVSLADGCYAITPKDGVFKRLNLITEKVYLELERDTYSSATLSTARDYVGFKLENQTHDAHTTKLTLVGLAAGTYPVMVGATAGPSITAVDGKPVTVTLSVGAEASYPIQIGTGCHGSTAGAVDNGTTPVADGTATGDVSTTTADGGRPAATGTGSTPGKPGARDAGGHDAGEAASTDEATPAGSPSGGCACNTLGRTTTSRPTTDATALAMLALGALFGARRRKTVANRTGSVAAAL